MLERSLSCYRPVRAGKFYCNHNCVTRGGVCPINFFGGKLSQSIFVPAQGFLRGNHETGAYLSGQESGQIRHAEKEAGDNKRIYLLTSCSFNIAIKFVVLNCS